MELKVTTKDNITIEIQTFLNALDEGKFKSDDDVQQYVNKIENMVPNSQFTNILFYGEITRDADEMAEEALIREKIYADGGKSALDNYIRKNCRAVFENPETDYTNLSCAVQILEGIEGHPLPELRDYVTKKHKELFPPKP